MDDRITLRSERDAEGSRRLDLRRDDAGNIRLEGQDLGNQVEAFWGKGLREYEWVHTIPAGQDRKIRDALGGAVGSDMVRLISQWCADHDADNLERTLQAHDVKIERWSWVTE